MSASFSHTVRLTESALSWLKAKLAKWPAVKVESTTVVCKRGGEGLDADDEIVRFDTRVSLDAPTIPGHELNARIEHLGDEGNIIYRCSGAEDPKWRTAKPYCDHCQTTRRRNDTFILTQTAAGRAIQVGRNCLAEYVRDPSATADLLNWADCVDRIVRFSADAEENFGSGRVPETYTLSYCLSWALAFGGKWVSASQARETGEQATAAYLLDTITQLRSARMFPTSRSWLDTREGKTALAIEARAAELRADETSDVYKTIEWIRSLASKPEAQISDYENNLTVLSRIGYVTTKQWSFACSAFRAWLRAQHIARGEEEKKARDAMPTTGEHEGAVGVRQGFPQVNCVLVKSLGIGDFGERFLVKFTTAAGNDLTWFTGEGQPFEQGRTYDITATPKEHGEFAKRRNTVIQRVVEGLPKPKGKKAKRAE